MAAYAPLTKPNALNRKTSQKRTWAVRLTKSSMMVLILHFRDEGQSCNVIGSRLGLATSTVSGWLHEHDYRTERL